MLDKNLDIIYNKEYLVIVPKISEHLLDGFSYTFGNTILMDKGVEEIIKTINFINKNNFKQLVFVDYQGEYNEIMLSLNKQHDIKMIFTGSLGALSSETILSTFNGIYSLYNKKIISKIGLLDENFYSVLKEKGLDVEYICLDKKINEKELNINSKEIGILNQENNPRHSFYNELSAIKLTNKYKAKIINPNKTTKKFLKLFNIKSNIVKNDLTYNNILNLYINFTDNNNLVFIDSMDNNVPCILGNTSLLDNYKELKQFLVMNSDDNIDEIKDRIELVIENRDKILKDYQKFRKDYSKKSKDSIKKFLGIEKEEEICEDSQLLLTAVVPVYNVENYIGKCLDSIIDAAIDNMEILVINDGSPDNSEKIIKEYVEKHPKLIRYIKQENHGLGNVRNVALKEAKGKYIASIDSDDTININFFKSIEKYLKKNIDVAICDWLTVTDQTKFDTPASDWIFNNDRWNRYEALLYTSIMPSTCNKIIKKSLFDELKLTYREDKFEDLSANPFILLRAKTIKYINKGYYEYYIRSNSIMRTKPGYSMIDVLKEVDKKLDKYKKYLNVDIEDFKYYTYSWRIEEYIINPLYELEEKELKDCIKYIEKELKDIMLDIFNNNKYKETIELLDEEEKKYINKRNQMFKDGKLEKIIIEVRKNNKYYKLTPGVMYYGK